MNYRLVSTLYKKEVATGMLGLYNPIKGHNFAFVSENLFKKLQNNSFNDISGLEGLVQKNFIVQKDFSEENYFESLKNNLKKEIHLMYLLLTQGCNLACGYCFENICERAELNKEEEIMPWEVADKAIDHFFNIALPERKVIFYGGEPLMNKEVFLDSVKKIKEKDNNYKDKTNLSMVTNGTLIDYELAKFIKDNNINVAVSIDGPEEIHNQARRNLVGNGSYYGALKGYNLLKDIGAVHAISCTVGKHNVNHLEEVARFFVNELKPSSVGFNFMITRELSGNNFECSIEEATDAVLKAFEVLRDNGIYEDRILRRLEPVTEDKFHLKDCAAYGNQIVVRYDGMVGPCHAFSRSQIYFEGNVLDPRFGIDNETFDSWTKRSQLNNLECKNCPVILLCGGGCAYNSYVNKGDINEIDTNICGHTKKLIGWILDETWKTKKLN
ncbi:MAG: radical SAM protein [Nanoarchaeota archaeon]